MMPHINDDSDQATTGIITTAADGQSAISGALSNLNPGSNSRPAPAAQPIDINAYGRTAFKYILVITTSIAIVLLGLGIWQVRKYRHTTEPGQCPPLEGNSDMYGLGVRIATYLQLALTACVSFASPDYGLVLIPVNLWFHLAFTIAQVVILLDPNSDPLECYVIDSLGNGILAITCMTRFHISSMPVAPGAANRASLFSTQGYVAVWLAWQICSTVAWWTKIPLSVGSVVECHRYGWIVVRRELAWGSPVHVGWGILNVAGWILWVYYALLCLNVVIILLLRIYRHLDYNALQAPLLDQDDDPSNTSSGTDVWTVPPKWRILLDCMFIFPSSDVINLVQVVQHSPRDKALLWENLTEDPTACPIQHVIFFNYLVDQYGFPPTLRLTRAKRFEPAFALNENDVIASRDTPEVLRNFIFWADVVVLCLTIGGIEFTLDINKVQGVYDVFTAGQLLALVVTIGGCSTLGMHIVTEERRNLVGSPLYLPSVDEIETDQSDEESGALAGGRGSEGN